MTQRGLKGSQLKKVSSPKLVYEFIKNAVLGGSGRSSVADVLDAEILTFDSAASAGGGASEALTVTGLLATDTILAVHQTIAGANDTAITEWNTQAADALTVAWTADPGAGAIIRVLVRRS